MQSKSWNPQSFIVRRSSCNALLTSPVLRLVADNHWWLVTTAMLPSRCYYSCYYAPELAHYIAIVSIYYAPSALKWRPEPTQLANPSLRPALLSFYHEIYFRYLVSDRYYNIN